MIAVEDLPKIFDDLSPIQQDNGPTRVCVIQYPSSFTLAYNYMRGVWASKEFSDTLDIIKKNLSFSLDYLSTIHHMLDIR